jgi:hypothetical protein
MAVYGISTVAADQDVNVGILRVSVQHHDFVAPSTQVSFMVDVEYAVHDKASIKSELYNGTFDHLGAKLWESSPFAVIGPMLGDQIWTANLTSPPREGDWNLTAVAYYQNVGTYNPSSTTPNNGTSWYSYNNSDNGPSFLQFTVKISRTAELELDLGVPNVSVKVDGNSTRTGNNGSLHLPFHIGENVTIDVPQVLPSETSTRLVFRGWKDEQNVINRTITLKNDMKIVGVYGDQYLLNVHSVIPIYAKSTWHDPGSSVILQVNDSVPMEWPFGQLGMRYIFKGWSGDVRSDLDHISVTMTNPMMINADFTIDYTSLVIPTILAFGTVCGIVGFLGMKGFKFKDETGDELSPVQDSAEGIDSATAIKSKLCDACGESLEGDWTHCPSCGKTLMPSRLTDGSS